MPLFLLVFSLSLLPLAALAFWPTYLSKVPGGDAYTHFHALAGSAWLAILIVQSALILKRRTDLHRFVGRASWIAAPLFVVSAVLLAHFRFSRMDDTTFAREAYTLYLPLSAALLFASAYVSALASHGNTRLHSRLMACTALVLVDPVLGRVLAFHVVELDEFWHYQLITFAVEGVVLLALAGTYAARAPGRVVFAGFAGFYGAVLALWFFAPFTPAWLAFARWFRQATLT